MAAAASFRGIGVPVKLLHEAEGHVVTVELKNGEILRGNLHEIEDNWNVQLSNVTATGRDGRVTHMEHIFVRGSRVRLVIVPDLLKNAPMFKRIDPANNITSGKIGGGGTERSRGGRR
jgi:small nuclear ribonucleoprotein D3